MVWNAQRSLCQLMLIFLLIPAAFAQEQSSLKKQAPLPVETAAAAMTFAPLPIDISVNGQWVAYVLKDPRLQEPKTRRNDQSSFTRTGLHIFLSGCDVWVTNTRSGESRNLTEGQDNSWGPRWSPDGSLLAFYSDRGGRLALWIWETRSGKLRHVPGAITPPSFTETVDWMPDGKRLVVKMLTEEEDPSNREKAKSPLADPPLQPTSLRTLVYSSSSTKAKTGLQDTKPINMELPKAANRYRGDLVMIDISNGKLQQLTRGVRPSLFAISPRGSEVVLAVPKQRKAPKSFSFVYDLIILSLANLRSQIVAEFVGTPSLPVAWAPDGNLLSYVSEGECFIYQINGAGTRKIVTKSHPPFGGKPLWDPTGQFIYLRGGNELWKIAMADGSMVPVLRDPEREIVGLITPRNSAPKELYVAMRNYQSREQGFYGVKLATGEASKLTEDNKFYNLSISQVSADGQQIVFGAQDSQHDEDLWLTDAALKKPRQLTNVNPQFEQFAMGASRLIDYKSSDGQALRGALLLPAGYQPGKRYPLIVKVYGGEMLSRYVNEFGFTSFGNDHMQLFATRGYAVLMPDSPLRVGTPMQDLTKTVLPAVDRVIEMGIADPERLGILGTSYGGYSTLSLIVQTTRFKAAHMNAGLGNLISNYGDLTAEGYTLGAGWAESGQGRMGGTPWEFRERYIENSPVFYLDRVQTPLFVSHGALDTTTIQSDEVFVGLERLGKEVLYVKYEGEAHGIEGYANKTDYLNRLINWFDTYLKK